MLLSLINIQVFVFGCEGQDAVADLHAGNKAVCRVHLVLTDDGGGIDNIVLSDCFLCGDEDCIGSGRIG